MLVLAMEFSKGARHRRVYRRVREIAGGQATLRSARHRDGSEGRSLKTEQ
jgi:hypothetical protein